MAAREGKKTVFTITRKYNPGRKEHYWSAAWKDQKYECSSADELLHLLFYYDRVSKVTVETVEREE